jgi:cytochrome oxidase Cu insertion factor (SCO1/SenC/PrrC family)
MKRFVAICALAVMSFAAGSPAFAQDQIAKTNLKKGDVAPDFTLLSDEWKPVKLSDFRGKKTVVLAFYVLAFTGG